jgi:Sec-independent protein translocase protein TatA
MQSAGDGEDRLATDASPPRRRFFGRPTPVVTGENLLTARNRIQWGPIVAGVLGALIVFLLLTVLGIGIGASALGPRNQAGDIGTWAAIWGGITAIVAFGIGGWIAAATAAVEGSFAGLMNGLMVGAAGLLLIIWLTADGIGNLFGTIGSNVGGIVNAAQQTAQQQGISPQQAQQEAQQQAQQAQQQAQQTLAQANNPQTFDAIRKAAFGTFIGVLLPLLAAGLGGLLGQHERADLVRGTG